MVACGSRSGDLSLLELSESLSIIQPNEKPNVTAVSKTTTCKLAPLAPLTVTCNQKRACWDRATIVKKNWSCFEWLFVIVRCLRGRRGGRRFWKEDGEK